MNLSSFISTREALVFAGGALLLYVLILGALASRKRRLTGVAMLLVLLPCDWILLTAAIRSHFHPWSYGVWPSGAPAIAILIWLLFLGMTLLFAHMVAKPERY